jgi:hypothetical protein
VPKDASIAIESHGLVLTHSAYRSRNVRQLREADYSTYVNDGVEYLVASSQCYGPYFERPEAHPREYADYMRIFEQSQELVRFAATPDHPGPELRIFKVRR